MLGHTESNKSLCNRVAPQQFQSSPTKMDLSNAPPELKYFLMAQQPGTFTPPVAREDVVRTETLLDMKVQESGARETGICPVRAQIYSDCFEEVIEQVTQDCVERGRLLMRVRNEILFSMFIYRFLYEKSEAYSMSTLQLGDQGMDTEKVTADLESEAHELNRELKMERERWDAIEQVEYEDLQQENKKLMKELEDLKGVGDQFKVLITEIQTPSHY